MLPDQYRLRHKRDFDTLFREGRFVPGTYVNAKIWKIVPALYPRRKYTPNDLRIGFIVSIKVSKSAVKRNRMKRQMREVVRLLLKEERIRPGFLIAFMAKPETLGVAYADIEASIMEILRRSRLVEQKKNLPA